MFSTHMGHFAPPHPRLSKNDKAHYLHTYIHTNPNMTRKQIPTQPKRNRKNKNPSHSPSKKTKKFTQHPFAANTISIPIPLPLMTSGARPTGLGTDSLSCQVMSSHVMQATSWRAMSSHVSDILPEKGTKERREEDGWAGRYPGIHPGIHPGREERSARWG